MSPPGASLCLCGFAPSSPAFSKDMHAYWTLFEPERFCRYLAGGRMEKVGGMEEFHIYRVVE